MPEPTPTVPVTPLGVVVSPGALTASIRRAVETSLADAVPPGKRGALVAVLDEGGAKFAVAAKIGDDWKLAGSVASTWDGHVSGSVALVGSW